MKRHTKLFFFIFLYLLLIHAGYSAAKSSVIAYPESLIAKLGIDSQDILRNQEKFKSNGIHIEWMAHVHEVMPDIDPDMEDKVSKIHASMLYMKDRINSTYLKGSIHQDQFTAQSAELMKWFLKTHREMLSKKEYESLFGLSQNDEPPSVISTDNALGFPIKNPGTTVDMIREKFDDKTITRIAHFYQEQAQEFRDIKKTYETSDTPGVDKEQVKNDMLRIERELQAAYMKYCREILTDEQFNMVFGQPGNDK